MQNRRNYEYYEDILGRLRDYRQSRDLTKSDIAKMLGIDRSLYSRMEKGTKSITHDLMMKMYEIGIDIDYLVTGVRSDGSRLKDIFEKCMEERKSNFLSIIVAYINALLNNDADKKLFCRKELEILHFNLDKKNGEREGTIWLCIREIHGFTQEQLRKVLDINIKTYRKMEKGEIMPTLEVLMNLYLELGYYPSLVQKIDSDYLLMVNNVWLALSDDNRRIMENIAIKTLDDLNKI